MFNWKSYIFQWVLVTNNLSLWPINLLVPQIELISWSSSLTVIHRMKFMRKWWRLKSNTKFLLDLLLASEWKSDHLAARQQWML